MKSLFLLSELGVRIGNFFIFLYREVPPKSFIEGKKSNIEEDKFCKVIQVWIPDTLLKINLAHMFIQMLL